MATNLKTHLSQITAKNGSKTLTLEPSEQAARSGTHYFDFAFDSGNRDDGQMRIWSSELLQFSQSIDRVLALGFDEDIWGGEGLFPLEFILTANGGLGFYIHVRNGEPFLVMRRLASSYRAQSGDTAYTRYFNWHRYKKYVTQVKLPANGTTRDLLATFSKALQNSLHGLLTELVHELPAGEQLADHTNLYEVASQLTLAGQFQGQHRTIPFDVGIPKLNDFEIAQLSGSPADTFLSHCAEPLTPNDLSRLSDFKLDDIALKRFLSWDKRYDESVLKSGFLTAPFSSANVDETLIAVRDKSIFAFDPLLASLTGTLPDTLFEDVDSNGDWIQVPQYENPPFEQAISKGGATGPYTCALGKVVLPVSEKKEAIIKIAKPTPLMKRNRWRLVQLMDLFASQLANCCSTMTCGFDEFLVLQTQKLALTINDVSVLFEDEMDLIGNLVNDAKDVYKNVLTSQIKPRPMLQPSQLPKSNNS